MLSRIEKDVQVKYMSIAFVFFVGFALPSIAFGANKPGDPCVGSHEYTDISLHVMNKKIFGWITGYESDKEPSSGQISWSNNIINNSEEGKLFINYFSEFVSKLKLRKVVKKKHSVWDAVYATYKSDGAVCVLSAGINMDDISSVYERTDCDRLYNVKINGVTYSSKENPYEMFSSGIQKAGYFNYSYCDFCGDE